MSAPAEGIVPLESNRSCSQCGECKPEIEFPKHDRHRRRRICTDCHNERRRTRGEHVQRNRGTSEQQLDRRLRELYKITLNQYLTLRDAQGGVCAICRKPPRSGKRLTVDHCHATGAVRALLCTYCNVIVGIHENHRQAVAEYLATCGNGNALLTP